MRSIVLTPKAQDDIDAIAAYTLEHWGDTQMAQYVDEFHSRLEQRAQFS